MTGMWEPPSLKERAALGTGPSRARGGQVWAQQPLVFRLLVGAVKPLSVTPLPTHLDCESLEDKAAATDPVTVREPGIRWPENAGPQAPAPGLFLLYPQCPPSATPRGLDPFRVPEAGPGCPALPILHACSALWALEPQGPGPHPSDHRWRW